MAAEDFEQDWYDGCYDETDESRDRDFEVALQGLAWGFLSLPAMFVVMILLVGTWPAVCATAMLGFIYAGFIFIEIDLDKKK
jgi:hypothetical protein